MKAKEITIKLLEILPKRSQDIIVRRYGLKKNKEPETLESIGKVYGVSRERIRQLEISAKKTMAKNALAVKGLEELVDDIKEKLDQHGGVLKVEDFPKYLEIAKDEENHIYLIIDVTKKLKMEAMEKNKFHPIIHTSEHKKNIVIKSLDSLYKKIGNDDVLTEDELLSFLLDEVEKKIDSYKNKKEISNNILKKDNLKKILSISKKISSNYLGGWGRVDSRNIKVKGVRDMAYLTMNKIKRPVHFREIIDEIYKYFDKKVNEATCHNELIKDKRFILVGNGKYALREWDKYEEGTVAEVITKIINSSKKKLTAKEITDKVLESKDVKRQTIRVNLQNKKLFRKNDDNTYSLVSDSKKRKKAKK